MKTLSSFILLLLSCLSAVLCSGQCANRDVTTVAGEGGANYLDGSSNTAQFDNPRGITIDGEGNIYVGDFRNHRIRKIAPSGIVSTLAGSGTDSHMDGSGTTAHFNFPFGVATDKDGNVYVADPRNHRIRKITSSGDVSTFAGSSQGSNNGNVTSARFNWPADVAVDTAGNIYVADFNNNRIRKITPSGTVSTLAGSSPGSNDGNGAGARFNGPIGVATDIAGNVYVADYGNHRIRKITPSGMVSTLAGSTSGYNDAVGSSAQFDNPTGLAVDAAGNVYVADTDNHRIRKITPSGMVSTWAGSTSGYLDANGTSAQFQSPRGVVVDAAGNILVSDSGNNRIRKIGNCVLASSSPETIPTLSEWGLTLMTLLIMIGAVAQVKENRRFSIDSQ